jgi:undecaprenyl phosphate N,N'-diacetylbacillosamine 1-phosphate transferase
MIIFILILPVFLILFLLLFVTNNNKPFYFQARPGKNEKIFYVIKFKTMIDKYDSNGHLLPDEKRLTKIGALVRKSSLDEIPQLINVIKGDMSLIGPRPLLVDYLPLYSLEQRKRHIVKPGITGWAQVNGRNSITWVEKFKLDVYYVENISFLLDFKILLLTIKKVLKSEHVNSFNHVTMEKFTGN